MFKDFYYAYHKDRLLKSLRKKAMKMDEIDVFFKGNKRLASSIVTQLDLTPYIEGNFTHVYRLTKSGGVFLETSSYLGKEIKTLVLWVFNTTLIVMGLVFTIKTYYQTLPSEQKSKQEQRAPVKPKVEKMDSTKNQAPVVKKDTVHRKQKRQTNPSDSIPH